MLGAIEQVVQHCWKRIKMFQACWKCVTWFKLSFNIDSTFFFLLENVKRHWNRLNTHLTFAHHPFNFCCWRKSCSKWDFFEKVGSQCNRIPYLGMEFGHRKGIWELRFSTVSPSSAVSEAGLRYIPITNLSGTPLASAKAILSLVPFFLFLLICRKHAGSRNGKRCDSKLPAFCVLRI